MAEELTAETGGYSEVRTFCDRGRMGQACCLTHVHTSPLTLSFTYTQPATARLLLLQRQLQRATRCLLDFRLHSGQWTFERCCAHLIEQGLCPTDEAAAGEVLACAQKPGYTMAGFVGYNELVALRKEREAVEGSSSGGFSLGDFVRALLRHGTVPPQCVRFLNEEEGEGPWARGGGWGGGEGK